MHARRAEDELKHTTEEEQQRALMRGLGMIDVATWTVSSRTQPLSGHAASSSTSRPPRGGKPEKTKKSNNCLSKQRNKTNKQNTSESSALCRRHQLLTKLQRNPCVLSVSATF